MLQSVAKQGKVSIFPLLVSVIERVFLRLLFSEKGSIVLYEKRYSRLRIRILSARIGRCTCSSRPIRMLVTADARARHGRCAMTYSVSLADYPPFGGVSLKVS